jgi:hypothetical protein
MRLRTSHVWFSCVLLFSGCKPNSESLSRQSTNAPSGNSQASPKASIADSTPSEWHIGPGRAGPIASATSEADLRQRYGSSVETTRIQLGEGETAPGTVLYSGDSLRRAEIIWQDTLNRRKPARLILRGSGSEWQVDGRISLGTSLKDLERFNGRPFTLAGFGWDYAGVITDWQGGALDSALVGIKLYLDPGPAQYESAPYARVLGDRDYSSTLPAMQQLNPRVAQIFVDFQ